MAFTQSDVSPRFSQSTIDDHQSTIRKMEAVIAEINLAFEIVFTVVGVLCLLAAPRQSAIAARQLRSAAVACFVGVAVMLALGW